MKEREEEAALGRASSRHSADLLEALPAQQGALQQRQQLEEPHTEQEGPAPPPPSCSVIGGCLLGKLKFLPLRRHTPQLRREPFLGAGSESTTTLLL